MTISWENLGSEIQIATLVINHVGDEDGGEN